VPRTGDTARRADQVAPALVACTAAALLSSLFALAAPARAGEPEAGAEPPRARQAPRRIDVHEYRVRGAERLAEKDIEAALSPFLGPGKTFEDIEHARAALEKAYSDHGFQAVSVAIPQQTVREGVVTLDVTEGKVSRLRVRGARWFSPFDVRAAAPSVAEGAVPNFNEIVRDVYVLNQLPDRRVAPALRAGALPGTIEVDLNVEDHLPLHGSVEVNDRYSPGTTPLRLNGSVRYDNLWQAGHSLAASFQTAPERPEDGQVFVGSYLARFPEIWWLGISLNGIVQNSDISTLGGSAVAGRGQVLGARATFTLPAAAPWFQTLGVGLDYKHFYEGVTLGADVLRTPVTYWPVTGQYLANRQDDSSTFQLGLSAMFNLRATSSDPDAFDAKRYAASGSFILYRGDLGYTRELPGSLVGAVRLVGQWSPGALIGSEQLAVGGLETVRGYLEAMTLGDWGGALQLELRSPSFARWVGARGELRVHLFVDAGGTGIHEPLPEQPSTAFLWSLGGGLRFRLYDHVFGGVDAGVPMRALGTIRRGETRVQFRAGTEF
jgi:hemolysin activation/secretion protein